MMEDEDSDLSIPREWNDNNRAFLQALMSRRSLTFAQGQRIIAAILSAETNGARTVTPNSITEDTFKSYVNKAREAITPLDYDIRSAYHQVSREQTWALINAHGDAGTQLATSRTPDELLFINRILDAMFDTYNTNRQEVMAITAAQARKAARPAPPSANNANREDDADPDEAPRPRAVDRGLKHSDIERLLPSLVDEGWLEHSEEGFYSLTPRALMELQTWLVEAYNDRDADPGAWQRIKFCEACKEIVTVGQRCPDRDCTARLHDICAEAYWRTRSGEEPVCPKCQTIWTGMDYVGERAVTETAAAHRQAGRKRKRIDMDDSLEGEEAGEDAEPDDSLEGEEAGEDAEIDE